MNLCGYSKIKKLIAAIFFAAAAIFPNGAGRSEQSAPVTVGVLTPGLTYEPAFDGLREGLGKLGYRENREVRFVVADTKGSLEKLSERAAHLVALKPSALFTVATAPSVAAKQATQAIPIVFALVSDPVQTGLVAGYGSSKNNVTGVVTFGAQLSGKRLEVLKEIAPQAKKVLAVVPVEEPISLVSLKFLEDSAKRLGLQIVRRNVTNKEAFDQILNEKWAGSVDAVYSIPSVLVTSCMHAIIDKSKKERLPLVGINAAHTRAGALASYSGDYREYGVQAGKILAKVLNGVKPADIPIETPDRLLLVINMATAKTIGINIPRKVLIRADRLVE